MMAYRQTALLMTFVSACTSGQIQPTDVQISRDTQVLDALDAGLDRGVGDIGTIDAGNDARNDTANDGSTASDLGTDSQFVDANDAARSDTGRSDTGRSDSGADTAITDARTDAFASDAGTTITSGAIAITEIFPDPRNGDDRDGEWFEVWNTTERELSFDGCRLEMNTGDPVMLSGSLAPNAIATFGDWPAGSDIGGFVLTHSYHRASAELALSNSGNYIRFYCNEVLVEQVNSNSSSWPTQATPGRSYALSAQYWNQNAAATNDGYSRWCLGAGVYAGTGDTTEQGTPGVINAMCP